MCKYHWVDDMNTHSVIVPNLSPLPPESPRILPAWFTMITSSEGHISKQRSRLALRGRRIPSHPLRTTEQAGLACAAAARTLAFTPVVAAERPREAVAGQRGCTGVPLPTPTLNNARSSWRDKHGAGGDLTARFTSLPRRCVCRRQFLIQNELAGEIGSAAKT